MYNKYYILREREREREKERKRETEIKPVLKKKNIY